MHLKCLKLVSLLLLAPSIAVGEVPVAPPVLPPVTNSFADYIPQISEYQDELHPLVKAVNEAMQLPTADTEARKKAFTSAIALAKKNLKKLPRGYHDEIALLGGLSYDQLGDSTSALKWYFTSYRMRSDNPVPLFRHAALLKQSKECDKAVPEFQEVIWRTNDHSHETLFLLSQCFVQLGQDEHAANALRTAYQQNPQYVPVLKLLIATRAAQLQKPSEAAKLNILEAETVRDLQAITTQRPDERDASVQLARLLVKRSDPFVNAAQLAQAETLAKTVAENSNYSDDEAVKVLIDARLKRREFTEAEEALKKGLEKKPKSALLASAAKQIEIEKAVIEN